MSHRQILQTLEQYQKSRQVFVQAIADHANRSQSVDALFEAGVINQLKPLLMDNVPTIQQTAALALGRMANHSERFAEAIIDCGVLPHLVYSLTEQNRFYKKAVAFVLRTVAKHSYKLAQAIVDCGALEALVVCLGEFDPGVKESAAWALGDIAKHNPCLAQAVINTGALGLLVLSLQEPEDSVKRVAALALSEISKHTVELAQAVVDCGAICHLVRLIVSCDSRVKRQVYSALSQISKHTIEMASLVVEAELFPNAVYSLKDPDDLVKKNAATLMREISKHSIELSQMMVNSGALGAVIDYLGETKSNIRLPGVMMLGYIGAHTENLAMTIIVLKGIIILGVILCEEYEDHILSATAWSIGQIGRHTPEHAKAVAIANILPRLQQIFVNPASSDDLKLKTRNALKAIIQKCTHIPALEQLLHDAPVNILKHIICQYSKILPHDSNARRMFVTSGGLKKVQEIQAEEGSQLRDYINIINSCYPDEIIKYYSPGYPDTLLEQIE